MLLRLTWKTDARSPKRPSIISFLLRTNENHLNDLPFGYIDRIEQPLPADPLVASWSSLSEDAHTGSHDRGELG